MSVYNYKRNDERPPLETTVTRDGDPIDLTNATSVSLYVNDGSGGLHVDDATMSIDDAEAGEVSYEWSGAELDIAAGTYKAEYVIDWSDGDVQTVPAEGFARIDIDPRLG